VHIRANDKHSFDLSSKFNMDEEGKNETNEYENMKSYLVDVKVAFFFFLIDFFLFNSRNIL